MGNKYQFKTKDSIKTFDTKNEFIEHCQARYNDSFNSRRTFGFYFSYDYGRNWYPIQDFKGLRQTIQNEKKSEFFNSNSTKHTASSFNWIGSVVILFFIWLGLSYFNVKIDKIDFVNEFNGRVFGWNSKFVTEGSLNELLNQSDNEQQTISEDEQPENNSTSNLNEEQGSNDLNSQTDVTNGSNTLSIENNSSVTQSIQNTTPQQQSCFGCKGTGECRSCSKTFRVHYWDDRSNGWKDRNESRKGYTMCSDCQGSGVKYKRGDYSGWVVERKCHVGTCNDGWTFCKECNSYGSGRDIGKCRECRGTGYRN